MTPPFKLPNFREMAERWIAQLPQVGETAAPRQAAIQGQVSEHTGAYYHKVASGQSADNRGIRGAGTLPEVSSDPRRNFVGLGGINDWQTGPLDRPSIYMGGTARGHELDAGLSWGRRYDEKGRPTFTDRANGTDGGDPAHRFTRQGNVVQDGNGKAVTDPAVLGALQPNFAFRAFWRTTNSDEGNLWNNADKSDPNQYFYPGQKINMSIDTARGNQVQMRISAENGPTFAQNFRQQGFGEGGAQLFKRVNSIDQFDIVNGERMSLEKTRDKTVRPTRASALGGSWDEVSIIRGNGSTTPLPINARTVIHGSDVDPRTFQTDSRKAAAGGEAIDIIPIRR